MLTHMKTTPAIAALSVLLLAGCASPANPFETALKTCKLTSVPGADLGDNGRTLILDHKGEDESEGLRYEKLACVLAALNIPDAVAARMDATRSLDGMQTGEWDNITASWTYHPDNGLDVILELRD